MEQANPNNYQFMNVKDIIDTAFGELDGNAVNFKLIQIILYLLARQLRMLERRVEVNIPTGTIESSSSFKVTEVKLHALTPKSAKKDEKGKDSSSIEKASSDKSGKKKGGGKGRETSPPTKGKDSSSKQKPVGHRPASLEKFLNMREKELRIIHQRADSREQPQEVPTPMASIDTMEVHYEKLLVVERVPSGERDSKEAGFPQISVVTQEEFTKLANAVKDLQAQFGPIAGADSQLLEDLRKKSSLTDAMAAMQLSARLEAAEKALERIIEMITIVVRNTPGLELDGDTKVILGAQGADQTETSKAEPTRQRGPSLDSWKVEPLQPAPIYETENLEEQEPTVDYVTYLELDVSLRSVVDDLMKKITSISHHNTVTAEQAFKLAAELERRLDTSFDVGPRMNALETLVSTYAEQINTLDTGLSSQMTNYQEQLIQMQHELEVGLEAMAEALANAQGGDTVAVAELNNSFLSLQMDYETLLYRQRDLQESHETLATDLSGLWKQIEMLRDIKSDRDEVTDALRDKAGIRDLNGLVSLEQFDAVRGDLEKRIAAAYDKFNNQEMVWQKAIDDLLRELDEKADIIQIICLKEEINKYINAIKARMKIISDIVGEPRAAIVNKKLFRDTACISCSTPATMDIEEPVVPPALPKLVDRGKSGAETTEHEKETRGDGDHKICYPGYPLPHPRHPRSHICRRYCGGSHTLISGPAKVPFSTVITPLSRQVTTEQGADGKMYTVDDLPEKVPCLPCNIALMPEGHPQPSKSSAPTHDPIDTYEPVMVAPAEVTSATEEPGTPPIPRLGEADQSVMILADVTPEPIIIMSDTGGKSLTAPGEGPVDEHESAMEVSADEALRAMATASAGQLKSVKIVSDTSHSAVLESEAI